ncbi:unnamed protein product [Gongylonema pulchrum]|uniref:Uncharacterized protein n=1 Tax=Gongylonema pulchrum TaxID=637853 RepID=A0A183F0W5_9BILA|nr:unnamed protein product [Gongylonema pulchrum]
MHEIVVISPILKISAKLNKIWDNFLDTNGNLRTRNGKKKGPISCLLESHPVQ